MHHMVVRIDPTQDVRWKKPTHGSPISRVVTDGVHKSDFNPNKPSEETLSEGVKRLKPLVLMGK